LEDPVLINEKQRRKLNQFLVPEQPVRQYALPIIYQSPISP
jgi:hypothetical protein